MPQGRTIIDDTSPPGSWRAAIEPNASCKACGQTLCDHPDPIYAGLCPPSDGARPAGPSASGADGSFHGSAV